MHYSNIIVATDFSDNAERAATELRENIRADFSGSLTLITILPDWPVPFTLHEFIPDPETMDRYRREMLAAAETKIKALNDKVFCGIKGAKGVAVLSSRSVADELIHQAKERRADLLVLGSSGHGALGRLILGSTVQQVLRSAPCPTLVIPVTR